MIGVLAALGFMTATATISDCGSMFKITSLGLYPDPPVLGQSVYMDLQFTNEGAEITDGIVRTALTYNSMPITVDPVALCKNTECPIRVGYNNRSTVTTWPATGSGKFMSQVKWFNSVGEQLLCIQSAFKVSGSSFRGSIIKAHNNERFSQQVCQYVYPYSLEESMGLCSIRDEPPQ